MKPRSSRIRSARFHPFSHPRPRWVSTGRLASAPRTFPFTLAFPLTILYTLSLGSSRVPLQVATDLRCYILKRLPPSRSSIDLSTNLTRGLLHITADYVLSFWSPPRGGFKFLLNNAAPAFHSHLNRIPSLRTLMSLIRPYSYLANAIAHRHCTTNLRSATILTSS